MFIDFRKCVFSFPTWTFIYSESDKFPHDIQAQANDTSLS